MNLHNRVQALKHVEGGNRHHSPPSKSLVSLGKEFMEEHGPLESEEAKLGSFEHLMLDIVHIITCLYKFSIAIQSPAPRERLHKIALINVSHFENWDIQHINGMFYPVDPENNFRIEEELSKRLGKANTKRRQLLKYYEAHHKKIAKHIDKVLPSSRIVIKGNEPTNTPEPVAPTVESGSVKAHAKIPDLEEAATVEAVDTVEGVDTVERVDTVKQVGSVGGVDAVKGVDSVGGVDTVQGVDSVEGVDTVQEFDTAEAAATVYASTVSQTTVSIIQDVPSYTVDFERNDDQLSQTSYATTMNHQLRIRVPPPPDEDAAYAGEPFECPYCFVITSIRSRRDWKYVGNYTCTIYRMLNIVLGSMYFWIFGPMSAHSLTALRGINSMVANGSGSIMRCNSTGENGTVMSAQSLFRRLYFKST